MFEEYAAKTIGIDFGTNNSVVGVYNTKIEKPLVIENEEGVNSTPSAVLLREPLEFSDVGRSAKERAMLEPVVLSMKSLIGTENNGFAISREGVRFSILDAHKVLFQYLKRNTKTRMDPDGKLNYRTDKCVVSYPASFNLKQKEFVRRAAQSAGMKVAGMITEPEACALAYLYPDKLSEKPLNLRIIDLGAGTFDVALLSASKRQIKVLAVDGVKAGGDDIDYLMMAYFTAQLKANGIDLSGDKEAFQVLRNRCEECKIRMSAPGKEYDSIILYTPKYNKQVEIGISKADYHKLCEKLMQVKLMPVLERLAKVEKEKGVSADLTLLVGGSNVNLYFVNEFKKMYGNNCISYKSKEAVALGDAVYAYMLEKGIMKGLIYSENQSGSHSKIPKMKQVSNETLGLRILDGSGAGTKSYHVENLIFKNMELPVHIKTNVKTAYEKQTKVALHLYSSGSISTKMKLEGAQEVGTCLLRSKKPLAKYTTIEVELIMETADKIQVKALEKGMNQKVDVMLDLS